MIKFTHSCSKHGHRFEPRYDKILLSADDINKIHFDDMPLSVAAKFIDSMIETIYVCDVCVYCGVTVYRDLS